MFQKFGPANFPVPDLTGLMERFYCISTGRILFYKFLILKISKIEVLSYRQSDFLGFRAGYFSQLVFVGIGLGIRFLGFKIKEIGDFTHLTMVDCNHKGTGGVVV